MTPSEEQLRILKRLVDDYKKEPITAETLAFQTNTTIHHVLDVLEKLRTQGLIVHGMWGYIPTILGTKTARGLLQSNAP